MVIPGNRKEFLLTFDIFGYMANLPPNPIEKAVPMSLLGSGHLFSLRFLRKFK